MVTYTQAVRWVYENDDVSEITDTSVPVEEAALLAPVTVVMIANLWDKDVETVIKRIRKLDLDPTE